MIQALHIRVLLADDQAMVRQALRSALEGYPNIEVVGEASDGKEAVELAAILEPSVIVMDIAMSKMHGITATKLIRAQYPQIVVIGLSAHLKYYEVDAMELAGAFAVLSKENAVTELYTAIQRGIASIQPALMGHVQSSQG